MHLATNHPIIFFLPHRSTSHLRPCRASCYEIVASEARELEIVPNALCSARSSQASCLTRTHLSHRMSDKYLPCFPHSLSFLYLHFCHMLRCRFGRRCNVVMWLLYVCTIDLPWYVNSETANNCMCTCEKKWLVLRGYVCLYVTCEIIMKKERIIDEH